MNNTKKQANELMTDNSPAFKFLKIADKLNMFDEAVFVLAIATSPSGPHLLKHFKKSQEFSSADDDLDLAYSIFVRYKKTGDGVDMYGNNFRVLKSFGEVDSLASSIADSWVILNGPDRRYTEIEHPVLDHIGLFARAHRLYSCPTRNNVKSLIERCKFFALENSFITAFAGTNLFYILRSGMAISLMHSKKTTISKKSSVRKEYFDRRSGPAVAFKLKLKGDTAKAHFIHFISRPWKTRRRFVCPISEHRVRVGPLLGGQMVRERPEFFTQLTGECAFVSGYNGDDSTLTVICSERGLVSIQEYTEKRILSISDSEINWNVMRCRLEEYKTIVLFGPGLSVNSIVANDSDVSCQTSTICLPMNDEEEQQHSSFFQDIKEFVNHFCLFKAEIYSAPLLFVVNHNLYITFPSAADRLTFTNIFKKQMPKVEIKLVQEGILEYLTAECIESNKGDMGDVPKDCVNCYRPLTANRHDWVRLLFCGHDVCDNCFLDCIANNDQRFPLKCVACERIVSVHDMKVVFSRNFFTSDFDEYLLPILNRSIVIYLRDHHGFIRCKTADCQRLLQNDPNDEDALAHPTIFCSECKQGRCNACGDDVHEGTTCYQYHYNIMVVREPELIRWMNDSDQRRFCPNPNCYQAVERFLEGCNHFHCSVCQIHFCWVCENFTANCSARIYEHLRNMHGGFGIEEFPDELYIQMEQMAAQQIQGWQDQFVDFQLRDPELVALMGNRDVLNEDEFKRQTDPVVFYIANKQRINNLLFFW